MVPVVVVAPGACRRLLASAPECVHIQINFVVRQEYCDEAELVKYLREGRARRLRGAGDA